ncbi:hypothetical protein EVAR_98834_1 [Eumeta japonica]|uniref:Uncharacterized protein n=1 Tax=Eumeta variegata TaxID=151549 RepID=A0A4C1YM21_EUMVA|nr:hypothetical protein EVAR_98834_1 [Eumeta japonica]
MKEKDRNCDVFKDIADQHSPRAGLLNSGIGKALLSSFLVPLANLLKDGSCPELSIVWVIIQPVGSEPRLSERLGESDGAGTGYTPLGFRD